MILNLLLVPLDISMISFPYIIQVISDFNDVQEDDRDNLENGRDGDQ